MLRSVYNWTLGLAARKSAQAWLAGVSFVESSFFPIPPDVVLMPMCLAQPQRAFRFAFICTAASVVGGLFGYVIGAFLMDAVGYRILDFYGARPLFDNFAQTFREQGWWLVAMAGFTPFPFKVITIASGATDLALLPFVLASIVSRGARFYLVAALFWKFGAPIKAFIDKYFAWVTIAFFILFFGGFLAIEWFVKH
jgi:membrane protein YqaA with SNARE-associated domain